MNIFAFFSLMSAWFSFFLGSFVLFQNRKSMVNRLFFLYCFSLTWYSFIEFGMRQSTSLNEANVWASLNFILPFLATFLLHFVIVFTENSKWFENKLTYILIYGPAFIFSFLFPLTDLMNTGLIQVDWGWMFVAEKPMGIIIFLIWGLFLAFSSLYLSLQYCLKTTGNKKKSTTYVIGGLASFILIGILTEIVLPFFITGLPGLTGASFLFAGMFFAYAIWRHGSFALSPTKAADNIIFTMAESLLLLNKEKNIVFVNPATLDLLEYEKKELKGKKIDILAADKKSMNLFLDSTIKENVIKNYELDFRAKNGNNIPMLISGSLIKNETDKIEGVVCIATDVTKLRKTESKLKAIYKELEEKVDALEKFKELTVGRETRMIEMKKEIDTLLKKLGEKPRYNLQK
ncbi:MAG: histidine kinase N-terminal 7TM domain-containing protein [Petrotogales bacterium]